MQRAKLFVKTHTDEVQKLVAKMGGICGSDEFEKTCQEKKISLCHLGEC